MVIQSQGLEYNELVTKYVAKAAELMPGIAKKNVSPHTIRHSTATHFYINSIVYWVTRNRELFILLSISRLILLVLRPKSRE